MTGGLGRSLLFPETFHILCFFLLKSDLVGTEATPCKCFVGGAKQPLSILAWLLEGDLRAR